MQAARGHRSLEGDPSLASVNSMRGHAKGTSSFRRHRIKTQARLRRVNRALSQWDEYEAAELLPADVRPRVRRPTLSRESLKGLQRTLVEVIGEQELMWELRN